MMRKEKHEECRHKYRAKLTRMEKIETWEYCKMSSSGEASDSYWGQTWFEPQVGTPPILIGFP
jgi:hypothetical protein